VLVAGGDNGVASAELYDPALRTWAATGNLANPRGQHTATLLPNGKVLVAGGVDASYIALNTAELYDPALGTWTATGSLVDARNFHTATLLPDGRVLVTGGNNAIPSAELYDPALGTWTATSSLVNARFEHTATLLPNGEVLVAGGFDSGGGAIASAELYDPASGTWTAAPDLAAKRGDHTATLLPNGKVLVAGGSKTSSTVSPVAKAELYDPELGTWMATGSLVHGRFSHTETLLPNGKVLVAFGYFEPSAELYDVGLGFSSDWQPQITTAISRLTTGHRHLVLTGSLFQGISQASGGNAQDSSSNYPIVQLRSIDNAQVAFLPVDPTAGWSDTTFRSVPVRDFPLGPALVTIFTNGIPSDAKYLVLEKRHR